MNNTSLHRGCFPLRFNESHYLPWNHPDNIVSEEFEAYSKKVYSFLVGACFLIGGPANVINMAVFFKQGLRDRVNLCLFSLALFDDLFLLSSFCMYAGNMYLYLTGQALKTPSNVFMTNNNLVTFMGSGTTSCFLLAIIACERCYCVYRPLKYQTLLSTGTMAGIITSLSAFVFIVFFVVSYRYWIRCVYDPVTGDIKMKAIGSDFYRAHKTLIDYIDSIVLGVGVSGGITIVVAIATVLTIVKLRKIVTWRAKTSSSLSAPEVALTKMLVGSSVFFLICLSPGVLCRLAYFFWPEMSAGGRHHNLYLTTLWVLVGLAVINSSFNFFIYFSMGSRYRETFWALFSFKAFGRKGQH